MARADKATIMAALSKSISAEADPEGVTDLVAKQGRINIAADPAEIGGAIDRMKELPGYRWLAINTVDLFAANPKTFGTKVGIMDPSGRVLKAADLPRPK